jgi:hypothetical protein
VSRQQEAAKNFHIDIGRIDFVSIQNELDLFVISLASKCTVCNDFLLRKFTFVNAPQLLAFATSASTTTLDHNLVVTIEGNTELKPYQLRGVIYYGSDHFTSRIISLTGQVWFHDGIITGRSTEYEGMLEDVVLNVCRSKKPCILIYIPV